MAARGTSQGGLAARYAAALFDLADEQKQLDSVAGDLVALRGMMAESGDLRRLIGSPVLSRGDQGRAMAAQEFVRVLAAASRPLQKIEGLATPVRMSR